MKINYNFLLILSWVMLLVACKQNKPLQPISADEIKSHIAVLADDSLAGSDIDVKKIKLSFQVQAVFEILP